MLQTVRCLMIFVFSLSLSLSLLRFLSHQHIRPKKDSSSPVPWISSLLTCRDESREMSRDGRRVGGPANVEREAGDLCAP